jgi:hypothetical protein
MYGHLAFATVTIVASFIVGLSKGGLPLVGMLAVPIMSLVISPLVAAGLLLPIFVVSDVFGVYVYRREYNARNLKILTPAAVAGVGIAWAMAATVPEAAVTLFIGLIGVGFVISQMALRRGVQARPADVPRGAFWGVVTGVTSFMSHSGAPPFQIYVLPQQLGKMEFAGTATILFAVVNAAKLVPYSMLGQMNLGTIGQVAWYAPVAIAATFLGKFLTHRVPERIYFFGVMASLALVSLLLLREGGLGLMASAK